ncbi:protein FLX-like 1 [Dioscorea cayenensis subsp. rotundata]|uniref:Protein FLX-like 1 n=1 Tax=Dioscorea cayennensis subsp. rotundata TaxID=55577 RepID=A0AB40BTL5_DIOCR|nr:protein FLX-like 1 [Dioscorea cayenensis subsp. rotundata]
MAGRNRGPPYPIKGGAGHEPPPFPRGMGHPHHRPMLPSLIDEMRDGPPPPFPRGVLGGGGPRGLPPHPAVLEERLGAQHQEIQALLVDNQRLAATHVALKQELAAAQHELQRLSHGISTLHSEKDLQLREVYEKSMKMEAELRGVEAMRAELIQIRGDIQKFTAARQELMGQVQGLTQDLSRVSSDVQRAPALKAEIETMKQEVQRARAAIEYEKKGYAENYEQGQVMEKNLITMAREVEKLRAEVANAEKRARAAAAAGNQGSAAAPAAYGGNYGNPDPNYGGNPYPAGYGMNPVPGSVEGAPPYGAGSGHGSWGAYDPQRALGRR